MHYSLARLYPFMRHSTASLSAARRMHAGLSSGRLLFVTAENVVQPTASAVPLPAYLRRSRALWRTRHHGAPSALAARACVLPTGSSANTVPTRMASCGPRLWPTIAAGFPCPDGLGLPQRSLPLASATRTIPGLATV